MCDTIIGDFLYSKLIDSRKLDINKIFNEYGEDIVNFPASKKHHGAYLGGLLDHMISTATLAYGIRQTLFNRNSNVNLPSESSVVFTALVHDLGKIQHYVIGNSDNGWFINYRIDTPQMDHAIRTLGMLMDLGIKLDQEELQAITYHAGAYINGYKDAVKVESKLLLILSHADNLSAKILER